MAIGKHDCKVAADIDLRGAIAVGLDEAFTALEEAIHDLSDEQLQDFPVAGKNNIAWIVMHCLDNLDQCANGIAGGERCMAYERRWDLWKCAPEDRPQPGDPFPTREAMMALLHQVRKVAQTTLDNLSEEALTARTVTHSIKKSRADFYMRAIYHAMSHLRQIWLLRGALGLAEGPWPEQHWS
ncbi:MAG: DinB family protein [Chloroflexi bacterium]|nr:DinB family protein [Chloroflexota bacterium]